MNPPNNPIQMMMGAMQQRMNPMSIVQGMFGNDPRFQMFSAMVNGKNEAQLKQTAMNIARNNGVNIEQMAKSMGIPVYRNK